MGAVFAGRYTNTGNPVAVKILLGTDTPDAMRRRFEREAKAMMGLKHPGVCRAYDFGALPGNRLFLVLDLLKGEDLGQRLDRKRVLKTAEVLSIGLEAAAALKAAHDAGLVHRDIKPSNIFMHKGEDGVEVVKLLDFGLAVVAGGDAAETRITRTGEVLGTPMYMAPEQARGDKSEDHRTDIYGLGAVLYRALAGVPPFGAGTMLELLVKLLTEQPTPLNELRPDLPGGLVSVLMSAVSPEKADRPLNVAAFEALLTAQQGAVDGFVDTHRPAKTGDLSDAPTLVDEQRVMTVMLANGVNDLDTVILAIEDQGGRATPLGGGRVVGLFGGDVRQGGEAVRAVRSALAIRDKAAVIGIGTGRAIGGKAHFSGQAVNAAEGATRVLDSGVVLDEATARRVEGRFAMDGARVDREVSYAAVRAELPLIGRELELAELKGHALRAFEDEEPVAVLVTGPPGIGRSRMLREATAAILEAQPDVFVLKARCDSNRRYQSWWLVATVLRGWARVAEGAPDDEVRAVMQTLAQEAGLEERAGHLLAAALGAPVPAGVSPVLDAARTDAQLMRDQIVQALGDLIERKAHEGPILMAVDDIHLADGPSLEYLSIMLRRLEEGALAIIATGRDHTIRLRSDVFDNADLRRVELRELSRKAAIKLAVAAGVDEPIGDLVARQSGGNPLFVEEIVNAVETGDHDAETTIGFRMPLTMEAAIQARLDHLPPEDKDLVKIASVFGVRFYRQGLDALGVPGAAASLKRLRRQNLVVRDRTGDETTDAFNFRVGVVRDVAYGMLTDDQRAGLHRKVGGWLCETGAGKANEVARHLSLGADHEGALTWWVRAGDEAKRDGDVAAALGALERALPVSGDRELELRITRLELCASIGNLDAGDDEARAIEALAAQMTPRQAADILHSKATLRYWRADYKRAAEYLDEAIAHYETVDDTKALGNALSSKSFAACLGNLGDARGFAERALDVLADEPMLRARALQAIHYCDMYQGNRADARQSAIRALAAAEAAGDLRRPLELLTVLGHFDAEIGRYEDAAVKLREVVQGGQRIGYNSVVGYGTHNLAYVLCRLGRPEEGLAMQDQALELARAMGHERLQLGCLAYRALALLDLGRPVEAVVAAELALDLAEGDADEVIARSVLAMSHLKAGAAEAALKEVERARKLRDQAGGMAELEAELLLTHADAALANGDLTGSRKRFEEAQAHVLKRADELAATPEERQSFLTASPTHRRIIETTLIDA